MKNIVLSLALIAALFNAGCTATSIPGERTAQWGNAGIFVAKKLAEAAVASLFNDATSPTDGNKKADFVDGLAGALWTQGVVSSNSVKDLVDIFTPAKPHWGTLSQGLGDAFAASTAPPQVKANVIAEVLSKAAAKERKTVEAGVDPTTGIWIKENAPGYSYHPATSEG